MAVICKRGESAVDNDRIKSTLKNSQEHTFVKIGKFEDDDFTIRFQEVEEGNVIEVLEKVLRTLDYKFLIKNISFEGMNRIETLEYPVPALREMLLNTLIHRNYLGAPTQLRVYVTIIRLSCTFYQECSFNRKTKNHKNVVANAIGKTKLQMFCYFKETFFDGICYL